MQPTIASAPRARRALDDLSLALLIGMHLACFAAFLFPFSWRLLALAAGSYAVRMFAITGGYHRYFSHRSFKTSRAFQLVLAVLGTASMQNGPLWWAGWHRAHHRWTDTPSDPHSPARWGFWTSHIGWAVGPKHSQPDMSNIPDLTRWAELRWLDRHEWIPIVGWALLCFAIGGFPGLVWGFAIATVAEFHATMCINSLAHIWGTRRYETHDTSRNNLLLALMTFGEGWHNNHHFDPPSVRQGHRWWEIDVTFYVLRLLAAVGVVWDLRPGSASRG